MRSLTVVIPALNESENIPGVMASIPVQQLSALGWATEILVVDNGSEDDTAEIARELGARVIVQPVRGYGNAYKAGFANAQGQVFATGDADLTYPFEILPELLASFQEQDLDFLSTDRLDLTDAAAMKDSHVVGNHLLSFASRMLLRSPFRDSQSGMWIIKRSVWHQLDVRSAGMSFSQEIKHEVALKGFRCKEARIEYRPRGGEVKLNATRDGVSNLMQIAAHRMRMATRSSQPNSEVRVPLQTAWQLGSLTPDEPADANAIPALAATQLAHHS